VVSCDTGYLADDGSPSCRGRGIPGSPGGSLSSADPVAPGESVEEIDLITPAEIGKIIADKGGKNTTPGFVSERCVLSRRRGP